VDDIVQQKPAPVEGGPIARALQQVTALLTAGESLQAVAIQRQYVYLLERSRRKIVAATPARLIVMHRRVFGGFDVFDVRWQDLESAHISEGTFGATLTFTVRDANHAMLVKDMAGGGSLRVPCLRKTPAQEVYRLCQSQERSWREKNRVREMEELRAKAGGIQIGPSAAAPPGGASAADPDALTRLERASEMLKKGLISETDYESVKAKILSAL
jgi:hypothetical protein